MQIRFVRTISGDGYTIGNGIYRILPATVCDAMARFLTFAALCSLLAIAGAVTGTSTKCECEGVMIPHERFCF